MIVKVILAVMMLFLSNAVSSQPEDSDCKKIARAYELIAIQRDGGVPFKTMYEKFSEMRDEGRISPDEFSVIADMLVFVYSSDKEPMVLYQATKRACLQSRGQIEA